MFAVRFFGRFLEGLIKLVVVQSFATVVSLACGSMVGLATWMLEHHWQNWWMGFTSGFFIPAPVMYLRLIDETRLKKKIDGWRELVSQGYITDDEFDQLRCHAVELYSILKHGQKITGTPSLLAEDPESWRK